MSEKSYKIIQNVCNDIFGNFNIVLILLVVHQQITWVIFIDFYEALHAFYICYYSKSMIADVFIQRIKQKQKV